MPIWKREKYINVSGSERIYNGGLTALPRKRYFTITVSEEPDVSVPAGTFDTYRLDVQDEWSRSAGNTDISYRSYWLAKGIGWVKIRLDGVVYESLEPTAEFCPWA